MTKTDKILEEIFAKTTKGIKLGLDRMLSVALKLGNPQNSFETVHVAGTNGKGSVCHYIESAFRASGLKTGLYTSPHLINFSERFRINGGEVLDCEWVAVYKNIEPFIERYKLTFFEISTLIAFDLFRKNRVDIAVIETGLGGRLDATNIITPKVSIITNIGIDHTDYLGDTLEQIATEKFGIIKNGVPVVLMKPTENSVEKLAIKICSEKKSVLNITELISDKSDKFIYNSLDFKLSLKGEHQKNNALCALKTLELCDVNITKKTRDAICEVQIMGRYFKAKYKDVSFIFDVAHNPQAVDALIELLKAENRKLIIVAGLMADKDTSYVVAAYATVADKLILTKPQIDRSELAENLAAMVPDSFAGEIFIEPIVSNAIKKGIDKSNLQKTTIVVTGSFFTVGEAMCVMTLK